MHWTRVTVLALLGVMTFMSCSNNDNPDRPQEYAGVPLIILDTDIGSSTDDLFALEMLYRYEEQGRCRLLGVVVDRQGEQNAVFTDVMNTYFGHGDTPIGLVRRGIDKPMVWIDYAHVADMQDDNGQPMFHRTVTDYSIIKPHKPVKIQNLFADILIILLTTNVFVSFLGNLKKITAFVQLCISHLSL